MNRKATLRTGTMAAAAGEVAKDLRRRLLTVAIEADLANGVRNGLSASECLGVVLSTVAGLVDHKAPRGTAAGMLRDFADKLDAAQAADEQAAKAGKQ